MFTLSSITSPVTLAPGVSSCMRFRQRSSVLLPQPEGPMIAGTVGAGNGTDTSRTARCCPNSAVRCAVSRRSRVLADATMALPRDPAGRQGNDEHQTHQDERRGKSEPMPFIEWARAIHVNLQRQRLHRLADVERKNDIAERGEEQGRGLAGNSRDAHQAARYDAAQSRARHDLERGPPARIPERERRLPQRMRHQPDHFLGRARQHGDHQDGERDAARQRRKPVSRPDDERPGDDANNDRWRSVQHVRDEPHDEPEPPRAVLGEVQSSADADRHPDQRGEPDDDPGAHNRIRHAAPRLAGGHGTLREERPIDGRRTLQHQIAENQQQGEDRDAGEHDDAPRHDAAHEMAAEGAAVHSALLPTAVPRATRQMRRRAMAFTTTVTTKSPSPTSNSAERYMLVVASLNSLAIAAAMV